MRALILSVIDLVWLMVALGLLVWGSIILLKQRSRWGRGLGFVIGGGLLMAARFLDCGWRVIHKCVGGQQSAAGRPPPVEG